MLILLTANFPTVGGDSVFVANELPVLSAAFEDIYVFSRSAVSASDYSLPSNVHIAGQMAGAGGMLDLARVLFSPGLFPAVVRTIREIRRRGRDVRMKRTIRAALLSEATGRQLRTFLSVLDDRPTVIYSFWAADSGYVMASIGDIGDLRVCRLHRFDLYEELSGHLPFREEVFENSDLLLPISDHGAAHLRSSYPREWTDRKILVSRLGTVDHGLGPKPDGAGPVRVVSCSNLIPVKRVQLILKSVAALSESRDVEWVHFGDGSGRNELERLLEALEAPGLVVTLKGAVGNDTLMDYYASTPVDLFLNLSASEGVPVSIMEALSFGIPVVATDVGGSSEVVSPHLGSGELVSRNAKSNEVAEVMRRVLDNRESYDPRSVWERLCSTEANTLGFVELIRTHLRS